MIFNRGVFTALVTPFTADASAVDFERLAQGIARQAAGGVSGVVPCGTTGEAPTLSDPEQCAVIERTVEEAKPRGLLVMAGAGSNETRHALELHRFAHQAGADAALHVCPYYNKPSQEGLYRHFMALADSCDLPIMLYNIPGRTGVTLGPATIERLARHKNIQAIKDATGSLQIANEILNRTELPVFCGDDPLTLPLMAIGAAGVVSVISNVLPHRVAALCSAVDAGDLHAAREIHFDLLPLAEALLSLDSNPVPVKAALQLLDRDTGAVRAPLVRAGRPVLISLEQLLLNQQLLPSTR